MVPIEAAAVLPVIVLGEVGLTNSTPVYALLLNVEGLVMFSKAAAVSYPTMMDDWKSREVARLQRRPNFREVSCTAAVLIPTKVKLRSVGLVLGLAPLPVPSLSDSRPLASGNPLLLLWVEEESFRLMAYWIVPL